MLTVPIMDWSRVGPPLDVEARLLAPVTRLLAPVISTLVLQSLFRGGCRGDCVV